MISAATNISTCYPSPSSLRRVYRRQLSASLNKSQSDRSFVKSIANTGSWKKSAQCKPFLKDDMPCFNEMEHQHITISLYDTFWDKFPRRRLGRWGPLTRAARSPDLSLLVFCEESFIGRSFSRNQLNLQQLKDFILRRITKDFTKNVPLYSVFFCNHHKMYGLERCIHWCKIRFVFLFI